MIDCDYSIKFCNLNQHFLRYFPEFVKIFKSGKISYLVSAAQSENNYILRLMQRGYTVEE